MPVGARRPPHRRNSVIQPQARHRLIRRAAHFFDIVFGRHNLAWIVGDVAGTRHEVREA
jgi:hypothetical protein